MQNYNWQIDNFALGMHTEPAKTQGGERYAAEIQNMRVDSDGWLRERSAVQALGPNGANITGVAATPKHIFVLRADGKLYIRDRDDLDTETEITGVFDLDGRISIVDFNTYIILTSEGADQGFWIDLRDDDNIVAYPFGFDGPGPSSITVAAVTEVPDGVDTELTTSARYIRYIPGLIIGGTETVMRKLTPAGLTPNRYYHYRWTYISLASPNDPWYGQESNPSLEADVQQDETQRGILQTDAGVPGHSFIFFTIGEEASATFGKITIAYQKYPLATHIRIYRSNAFTDPLEATEPTFPSAGDRRDNILENLTYRLIGEVDITDTIGGSGSFSFYDALHDGTSEDQFLGSWSDAEMIRTDNDRLPEEVRSIHKYNDLIFAPAGDRLIYSDIRDGSLVPWAYPPANEIRTGEQITFCAELREVLLFGGRGRLSRLTGTDEYNFNIDTLSHRGPVDGYSWNRLTDVLAYIGEGAFFVTNASDVQAVSEPILNKVFKDKQLLTGSVAFLQDGDILYDFKTLDGRYQYKLEDGAWARWADIDIVQVATIIERVNDQDCATVVLIADGTGVLKELNWNSTEGAADADWRWESNIISGLSQGVANKFKRFRELEWTGQADGDVTLEVFNADDPAAALSTKVFNARESLRPVRVPINRKMRRMVFRVSGTGIVKLQGLRLEMQV